jgi:hypothetical protein
MAIAWEKLRQWKQERDTTYLPQLCEAYQGQLGGVASYWPNAWLLLCMFRIKSYASEAGTPA